VRIEIVPLRPPPGDVYILSTRPLRDGELAVLARDMSLAKDGVQLLRAGVEGASDRGRVAIRVLESSESDDLASLAESIRPPARAEAPVDERAEEFLPAAGPPEAGGLPIEPLRPEEDESVAILDSGLLEEEPAASEEIEEQDFGASGGLYDTDLPAAVPEAYSEPASAPRFLAKGSAPPFLEETEPAPAPPFAEPEPSPATEAPEEADESETSPTHSDSWPDETVPESEQTVPRSAGARPRRLASVGEERPWYEPLALWGGGALAVVALALLVKSLVPGILGTSKPRVPAPHAAGAASGLADIFSEPPGATVRVDGVALEGKTPLVGVSLDAGLHRVELDWGPWGIWRDTLDVTAGTRMTIHPALHGRAAFRSSDPARPLDVYLDGAYAGTTPLALDQVVVGRHLVRFGGPGLTMSAQEIEVLRDASVELVGNAGPVPENGKLTIRTAVLGDEGFESGKGDPYWVDGVARGVTPATIEVKPGTHSVRVARRGFPPQIAVLDVRSGAEQFVTAEFGARSEEPLRFEPPEEISISNPTPLTIALPASEWDPAMSLWLYAASPAGTFQAKRMTRLEEGTRTFAALLPPEVLRSSAREVRFYFKATGAGGREIFSEIYSVPVRD
jgi:hypothetical protein